MAAAFWKPFKKGVAAFESHGNIIFVMFACDQFPKEENLSDDEASFLDLESKYPQKAGNKNHQSPNLGCIIDDCSSYINSHDITSLLNSIYTFVCIRDHNMK